MLNENLNKSQTTPSLKRLELEGSIPIIIPKNVLDKIKYLCKTMAKVEWSGVLFYETKGSIKKTETFKIILRDIFLMDRGTSGSTEFTWDEDIVSYRMANPASMDWTIGHIHSHNSMSVFFSDTDWQELNDNSPKFNYYLSIIVNNYMDMLARIAFTADIRSFTCKDEEGEDYPVNIVGANISPYMFTYKCVIEIPQEKIKVPIGFEDRVKIIEAKAELEAKRVIEERKKLPQSSSKASSGSYTGGYPTNKNYQEYGNYQDWGGNYKKKDKTNTGWDRDQVNENDWNWDSSKPTKDDISMESKFAAYLLRLGKLVGDDDEVSNALEDIELAELNIDNYFMAIIKNYDHFFKKFFEGNATGSTPKAFDDMIEKLVALLKKHKAEHPYLDALVEGLLEIGVEHQIVYNFTEID